MLNGVSPLIIFTFKKLIDLGVNLDDSFTGPPQPLVAGLDRFPVPFVPIPVPLKEEITGVIVQSHSKSIDIKTESDTFADGKKPNVLQKGLNSSVTVQMTAKSDSIGMSIILALMDQIIEKVTSKEYNLTYINGAICVFNGLLDSFSMSENDNSNEVSMTMVISKVAGSSTVETAAPTVISKVSNVTLGF